MAATYLLITANLTWPFIRPYSPVAIACLWSNSILAKEDSARVQKPRELFTYFHSPQRSELEYSRPVRSPRQSHPPDHPVSIHPLCVRLPRSRQRERSQAHYDEGPRVYGDDLRHGPGDILPRLFLIRPA